MKMIPCVKIPCGFAAGFFIMFLDVVTDALRYRHKKFFDTPVFPVVEFFAQSMRLHKK